MTGAPNTHPCAIWYNHRMRKTNKQRFDEKWEMDGATGCWLWRAYVHPNGYGRFSFLGNFVQAHRASYEIHHGEIPEGMHVCHTCDRPLCVNPGHLFLGTREDNMRDRDLKLRQPFGAKNGNAQLTDGIARRIFDDPRTRRVIAAHFWVSRSTVQMIKNGRRWAHIHAALR